MSISSCQPCCSTPVSTAVPGPQGNSAVTATTASFVIPAIGATVVISVGNTAFFLVGENVYIGDGSKFGNFQITALNSSISMTVKFLGFVNDSAAGSTIASGALVVNGMGNYTVPWDLDTFTAFTDNSGGTKSDTIASTIATNLIVLGPFSMAALVNNQLWEVAIPYAFKVNSITFRCDVAITTGGKSGSFQTRISTTPTGGGNVALSGTYATGATQAGTSVTAPLTGSATNTLEALYTLGVAFTEGVGHLEISITNTDMTAFIAAVADKLSTLRTRLRHQ